MINRIDPMGMNMRMNLMAAFCQSNQLLCYDLQIGSGSMVFCCCLLQTKQVNGIDKKNGLENIFTQAVDQSVCGFYKAFLNCAALLTQKQFIVKCNQY